LAENIFNGNKKGELWINNFLSTQLIR
jgi:hypothetical protein